MASKVQVERIHSLSGHQDCVYTICGSNDESNFFSAGGDGMVVRWNLNAPEEGDLIARLPNSIYAIHQLIGEDVLVVGHNYDGIHLLDCKSKKEISSLHLSQSAIFDIQSYDRFLVVATGDGSLFVIDRRSNTITKKISASSKSARAITLNLQRGEAAVGYSDNFIRIFSLEDWSLKGEWQAHQNSIFTLKYTPDGNFLISGSRDARLKIWDLNAQFGLAQEVVAHLFAINHITYSPDGKHFVTCSMDKSIKVWDAASMKLLKVIDKARHAGHGTSVNKLLWTPFFNQLVSASDDRTISVWKLIF